MYLSLIIPAYNEAARIGSTLALASAYFKRQPYEAEIVVVDDGSTDDTSAVVKECMSRCGIPIHLETLPKNRGKGFAVHTGMLNVARGRYRFFYDADASTPIEEIDRCHLLFEGKSDIVIGSRSIPGAVVILRQAWYREFMGRCYNYIEKALGLTQFADTQCGFKGFTANATKICFSRQTIDRFSFDAELLYIAKKHELTIVELPVHWRNCPHSKVKPVRDASRMFYDLLGIRVKDMLGYYE